MDEFNDYEELFKKHLALIGENEELRAKLEKAEADLEEMATALSVIRTVSVKTNLFDLVEEHDHCHVQVLKNSITGDISVGWWKEEE